MDVCYGDRDCGLTADRPINIYLIDASKKTKLFYALNVRRRYAIVFEEKNPFTF